MIPSFYPIFAGVLFASMRAHGTWGVAYAPAEAGMPRPAVVYMHGMWASPEDSCSLFERASMSVGFLVCPRGNAPLGEGRMWAGNYASVAPSVHAALHAAEALAPGKLDRTGGTLVGHSNGAYFAALIAESEPGQWTGLVLMDMHLELDAARLRTAGVRRTVLAAGDRDGAKASMQALADKMNGAGLPTRFIGLGPVGHEFPSDMEARMSAAIAWVRGVDPT